MLTAPRSRRFILLIATSLLAVLCLWTSQRDAAGSFHHIPSSKHPFKVADEDYLWRKLTIHYPVQFITPLPTDAPKSLPKIQAEFAVESEASRKQREERQAKVKETFLKSWHAYKKYAWLQDELKPVSGGSRNPFGGWAASLVDALDTLWIMDLKQEFAEAVEAAEQIDFTETSLGEINVFETSIRYLGGFLSAYDLSQDVRLLQKATEVGDMIYKAFDTPNRMPIMRWKVAEAKAGEEQVAGAGTLVAEIGSLCMELTRLSQITGDPRWFDAAHRITEELARQQDSTELPGLWPLVVDAEEKVFNKGSTFTLGAMADSLYEYLPKMVALTGGQLPIYETMYKKAMDVAPKHLFYKPLTPSNEDILVSSAFHTKDGSASKGSLDTQGQHLVCFLGGMLAIGSKLLDRPQDQELAEKLANGCVYVYQAFPQKVMPETWHMVACATEECPWDEAIWRKKVAAANSISSSASVEEVTAAIREDALPQGFARIPDRRYILRPEALESLFVLCRVTGLQTWADKAWDMFTAIEASTATELANSAVSDVTRVGKVPPVMDSMESFWMGETLKYAYLAFSDPGLISLDEWVFNTEAHPFKRLPA